MLVLGHAIITLGTATLLTGALTAGHLPKATENETVKSPRDFSQTVLSLLSSQIQKASSWLTSLGNLVDIRLLLIGAVLSDIIDKPLGLLLFKETFSNGRIFCHTLFFLFLITFAGFYLYRSYRKTWLLGLSFGTFTHLILDQMWLEPRTLLWPLFGFTFEKVDLTHWMQSILYALRTDMVVYIPEFVGAAILIWFVLVLIRRRKFYAFIKNGQV